jgi:NAD(P)-dependent dehydrogenase (short-subunit alcohol dehydrogenase family)
MPTVEAELLRPGLLDGVSILLAGLPAAGADPEGAGAPAGRAVRDLCAGLGALVREHAGAGHDLEDGVDGSPPAGRPPDPDASYVSDCSEDLGALVFDGAAAFAGGGLRACLEGAWEATRAVVNLAFLPAGSGGRIVYLAPAPSAGDQADAARAGLENLGRTLSVEWARHGITVVTIALGDATAAGETAAIAAYLVSPAGAYFSGCQLDLRGP